MKRFKAIPLSRCLPCLPLPYRLSCQVRRPPVDQVNLMWGASSAHPRVRFPLKCGPRLNALQFSLMRTRPKRCSRRGTAFFATLFTQRPCRGHSSRANSQEERLTSITLSMIQALFAKPRDHLSDSADPQLPAEIQSAPDFRREIGGDRLLRRRHGARNTPIPDNAARTRGSERKCQSELARSDTSTCGGQTHL